MGGIAPGAPFLRTGNQKNDFGSIYPALQSQLNPSKAPNGTIFFRVKTKISSPFSNVNCYYSFSGVSLLPPAGQSRSCNG